MPPNDLRADDPFGPIEPRPSFARPDPGAWRARPPGSGAPPTTLGADTAPTTDFGLNELLALANPLLLMAPQLRQTRQADLAEVRAALAAGVREFEAKAQEKGLPTERVNAARYVLCTMLDEAAADTPWGGSGIWGRHSLLAEFYKEGAGGEKVFQLMARLADKPDVNLDLLELIYAAVTLGFEGRYRLIDNGSVQLEAVRSKLAQLIRRQRGPFDPALAPHWSAHAQPPVTGLSWLPLALAAALAVFVLGGIYTLFALSLSGRADEVYARIQGLRLPSPAVAVAQPAGQPRIATFLRPDIRAGLVAVRDDVDRSVITLQGDGLFAPASAVLDADREALLRRIAEALARVGGDVLVTGHTDNTPMRTSRFPSNWHLSEERARAVRDLIVAGGVPAERVRAEGRADGEPLVSNDTAAHRALNRRVEITLLAARPESRPRAEAASAPAR